MAFNKVSQTIDYYEDKTKTGLKPDPKIETKPMMSKDTMGKPTFQKAKSGYLKTSFDKILQEELAKLDDKKPDQKEVKQTKIVEKYKLDFPRQEVKKPENSKPFTRYNSAITSGQKIGVVPEYKQYIPNKTTLVDYLNNEAQLTKTEWKGNDYGREKKMSEVPEVKQYVPHYQTNLVNYLTSEGTKTRNIGGYPNVTEQRSEFRTGFVGQRIPEVMQYVPNQQANLVTYLTSEGNMGNRGQSGEREFIAKDTSQKVGVVPEIKQYIPNLEVYLQHEATKIGQESTSRELVPSPERIEDVDVDRRLHVEYPLQTMESLSAKLDSSATLIDFLKDKTEEHIREQKKSLLQPEKTTDIVLLDQPNEIVPVDQPQTTEVIPVHDEINLNQASEIPNEVIVEDIDAPEKKKSKRKHKKSRKERDTEVEVNLDDVERPDTEIEINLDKEDLPNTEVEINLDKEDLPNTEVELNLDQVKEVDVEIDTEKPKKRHHKSRRHHEVEGLDEGEVELEKPSKRKKHHHQEVEETLPEDLNEIKEKPLRKSSKHETNLEDIPEVVDRENIDTEVEKPEKRRHRKSKHKHVKNVEETPEEVETRKSKKKKLKDEEEIFPAVDRPENYKEEELVETVEEVKKPKSKKRTDVIEEVFDKPKSSRKKREFTENIVDEDNFDDAVAPIGSDMNVKFSLDAAIPPTEEEHNTWEKKLNKKSSKLKEESEDLMDDTLDEAIAPQQMTEFYDETVALAPKTKKHKKSSKKEVVIEEEKPKKKKSRHHKETEITDETTRKSKKSKKSKKEKKEKRVEEVEDRDEVFEGLTPEEFKAGTTRDVPELYADPKLIFNNDRETDISEEFDKLVKSKDIELKRDQISDENKKEDIAGDFDELINAEKLKEKRRKSEERDDENRQTNKVEQIEETTSRTGKEEPVDDRHDVGELSDEGNENKTLANSGNLNVIDIDENYNEKHVKHGHMHALYHEHHNDYHDSNKRPDRLKKSTSERVREEEGGKRSKSIKKSKSQKKWRKKHEEDNE